jgi:ATP-binding cassette, subfamily F, member 3
MLQITNLDLQLGGKILLQNANLQIKPGMIAGLIGKNGAGKSSLMKVLTGKLEPEKGEIIKPEAWKFAYLEQELPESDLSVLDFALTGDSEYAKISSDLKLAESSEDGLKIADCYDKLSSIDGYTIESRAAVILKGLGFTDKNMLNQLSTFSGGWQMRVQLARVLLSRADLILLDEPTNHLDLESVIWFENWLQSYSGTAFIISHDRAFLDKVTTDSVHLSQNKFKLYSGNYSAFIKQFQLDLLLQTKMQQKVDKKRAHMQSFVDRFKAKASKAKQAQSRVKALEKLQFSADLQEESSYSFEFFQADDIGYPAISIEGDCGYGADNIILNDVNLKIGGGYRVGIIGSNGSGKTTLLKTIAKDLKLVSGNLDILSKVKVGYFSQQHVDLLDFSQSPLQMLRAQDKNISEGQARNYLGGFAFSNEKVLEKAQNFSGGEKARVALALLIWQKPNVLILDEPTNHLDMQMREALILALQNYTGALLLVSHDQYLLECCVDESILVKDGSVKKFDGDFSDYRKFVLSEGKADNLKSKNKSKNKTKSKNKKNLDKKDSDKLEHQINKLEIEIKKLQGELSEVDEKLTDESLYLIDNKEKLSELNKIREDLADKISECELKWFELQDDLG